jgi:hypothetical protein
MLNIRNGQGVVVVVVFSTFPKRFCVLEYQTIDNYWVGVRLSVLGIAATTGLLHQPRIIDGDECRAVGGVRIGRGTRNTRMDTCPSAICPPQTPHDLTWN